MATTTEKSNSKKKSASSNSVIVNGKGAVSRKAGESGTSTAASRSPSPHLVQHAQEIQRFGEIVPLPNGLSIKACTESVTALNQLLADTMTLRDMYKKHHWQVVGPTFSQLHLLYDKHYTEQSDLVDTIAERIQLLGGLSIAMAADVAEMTSIPRPPRGREEAPVQLARLLGAHESIMKLARKAADKANDVGDPGTNDVMVSDVLRTNELQSWFLSEHLVNTPLVDAN
ncbi:MAG: DNA starvation/stationary phase protection protein [Herminiimonas sp.]|nr:DNA starvation/stationary phase protection protein [Herminiimonas sp.]